MSIKFSIIIPCYNVEKYIEKTIKSVLSQTYSNFELLLINDGSTDNTFKIIKQLKETDDRIRVFSQENLGVSQTRNKGISLSKGEFIYFLDGDDLIENNLLEKANEIFDKKEIDVFSFGYDVFRGENRLELSNKKFDSSILTSKEFLKRFFVKDIPQSICSLIVKKEIFKNLYFKENMVVGEDLEFQIQLLLNNEINIYYSSDRFFHYIRRENSATTTNKMNINYFNILLCFENLRKQILKKKIKEFFNYHIEIFFSAINGLSKKNFTKENYADIKKELAKYDYILDSFKFRFKKREVILLILIVLYKINLKLVLEIAKFKR